VKNKRAGAIIIDLKKKKDETEEQFLWRIGQLVDSGSIENWASVNDIINTELGIDEDKWRDESSFRKRYQAARNFYNNCFSKMESNECQAKFDALNRELQRNTIKFRDQRRSWSKQNYTDARFDEVMDLLEERLDNFAALNFPPHSTPQVNGTDSMIICLSDLHIGQTFSSFWGEYNSDVAKSRLQQYMSEILDIAKRENVNNAYVCMLGDNINNSLHKTIEVTNKENVIEQLKLSIEYITSFCYELTKHFGHVYLASASGNHSRLQAKDLAQHSERLDTFIAWDVCRTLEFRQENFHSLLYKGIDDGIAEINICGKSYLLIHGDFDNTTKQGYLNLANMLGFFPDYILCGHRHFCSYSQDTKFVQSGSLASGGDDYCIEHRLNGKASQMVCICNDVGIKSIHPIILN
jgi:hypothetical protein